MLADRCAWSRPTRLIPGRSMTGSVACPRRPISPRLCRHRQSRGPGRPVPSRSAVRRGPLLGRRRRILPAAPAPPAMVSRSCPRRRSPIPAAPAGPRSRRRPGAPGWRAGGRGPCPAASPPARPHLVPAGPRQPAYLRRRGPARRAPHRDRGAGGSGGRASPRPPGSRRGRPNGNEGGKRGTALSGSYCGHGRREPPSRRRNSAPAVLTTSPASAIADRARRMRHHQEPGILSRCLKTARLFFLKAVSPTAVTRRPDTSRRRSPSTSRRRAAPSCRWNRSGSACDEIAKLGETST